MCALVTNQLPDDIEHFDRLLGYGAPFKWRIAGRARGQGTGALMPLPMFQRCRKK